jgi:hypothetical protein
VSGTWRLITIEELSKLSDEQIVTRANELLVPPDTPTYLLQQADVVAAQFYMNELDRREKRRADAKRDRIDTRRRRVDLLLELLIVALIGSELFFAWSEGEKQFKALNNLEKSSEATAKTLATLQETMKEMNRGVQSELGLSYEVSLNVKYDITTDRANVTNEGRTSVTLWGSKIGSAATVMEKGPRTLTPGMPYSIVTREVYAGFAGPTPVGVVKPPVPFVMFLKNERGEEFVARYQFVGLTAQGPLQIQPEMLSITPMVWSQKRP